MRNKFKKFRSLEVVSYNDNFNNAPINKRVYIGNNNIEITLTKVRNLNYKFKRKSKNFFSWLEGVKNVHYSKTEGVIVN
jgi:hypothetical protein